MGADSRHGSAHGGASAKPDAVSGASDNEPGGGRLPGVEPATGGDGKGGPRSEDLPAESRDKSDPLDALLRDLAESPVEDSAERRGLAAGDRLGRYQVLRELGRGGFGVVYEARDVELGRHVAVKALRADRLRRGPSEQRDLRLSLLQAEAATVARLQHPNIVTLLDFVVQDGLPYLVLELLSGETMQARLAGGPLPVAEVLDAGVQVARGLAHAHAAGVIHRDLKPSNVFRTRDGLVKLLDLGLARGLAGSDLLPRAGTPGFMAPEQWEGQGDERTDLFGLGMMLHALLGGRIPQIGSATFQSAQSRTTRAQPPPGTPTAETVKRERPQQPGSGPQGPPLEPVTPPASAPPALQALISRCCALDPGQRPPSARALLDELALLQRAGADSAPRTPLLEAASRPVLKQLPPRGPLRFFALAAILMGAVALQYVITHPKKGNPPSPVAPTLPQPPAPPPAPDSLQLTAPLSSPRVGAAVAVLGDGLVLLAGGADENGPLSSAEVFDPAAGNGAGAFRTVGALAVAREGAQALRLSDGRVLVVAGEGRAGALDSTELFDPASRTFSAGPPLETARTAFSLVPLGDGRALVAGGEREGVPLFSAELFEPQAGPRGAFLEAGSLSVPRSHAAAAAVPLPEGVAVLVAGGLGPEPLDSAELFLPPPRGAGGGAFVPAAKLLRARSHAVALTLADGSVLVAGGASGATALASVERFDLVAPVKPGSIASYRGQFHQQGPLSTARHSTAALLLPLGEVLLAGGKGDSDSRLASAEVYDPFASPQPGANGPPVAAPKRGAGSASRVAGAGPGATPPGLSRPLGNLSTPRAGAAAVLLASGRALIAGGDWGPRRALSSAELYTPRGTSLKGRAVRTGDLHAPRAAACAVALGDGKVAVIGGRGASALASIELFDARAARGSGAFSAAGNLGEAREQPLCAGLGGGLALVAGGFDDGGHALASAELLEEGAGQIRATPLPPLTTPRAFAAAVRLADGRVLIAGGLGEAALLRSAELFDPRRASPEHPGGAPALTAAGPMATARGAPMAALLADGRVLIAGGLGEQPGKEARAPGEGSAVLATAELYDPRTNSFAPTGAMATARTAGVLLLLPGGKVLVAGGLGAKALASAELFDPAADNGRGAFVPTGGLASARDHAAGALLPNGRALLLGGLDPTGGPLASAELYDPAIDGGVGGFGEASGLSVGREACTATLLPGGGVLIAGGRNTAVLASAEIWKLE